MMTSHCHQCDLQAEGEEVDLCVLMTGSFPEPVVSHLVGEEGVLSGLVGGLVHGC